MKIKLRLSSMQQSIVAAAKKGYTISEQGEIFNPKGEELTRSTDDYPAISVSLNGVKFNLPLHRLQAYTKYGAKALEAGVVVRHLDGNKKNCSSENISIDNPEAAAAASPRPIRASKTGLANQKRTPAFIEDLRRRHFVGGESFRQLHAATGISKSTLSFYLSKKAKRQSVNFGI